MGQTLFTQGSCEGVFQTGCAEHGGAGDVKSPPVELSVAHHLNPNCRAAFSSALLAGCTGLPLFFRKSIILLFFTSLLIAYEAELMEEMGKQMGVGASNPALWEDICATAGLSLRTFRGAVQSCDRNLGLAVVGERPLWLGLSGLSDRERWTSCMLQLIPKPFLEHQSLQCDRSVT